MHIEGDHDAPFLRSERQEIGITPAIKGSLFVRGSHLMAGISERFRDSATRYLSVEKEAHL